MIYFIVNPAAGSGKAEAAAPIIENIMQRHGADYEIIRTSRPNDVARVAGMIDFSAAEAIICVGGDGTVQEYVGLAVGRGINFGVIPAGSANDLLLSTSDGKRKFKAFEEKITFYTDKIIGGKTTPVDVIILNKDRYLLNIGGTGIDIKVLQDALPMKKRLGAAAYFISLIKNSVTYKSTTMTLTVDGVKETGNYLLLAVSNGQYYGGNLRIAPPALIDDGKITLCKVCKMPRIKLMLLFPLVKPGWHTKFREVTYVECTDVMLEFDGKKTINLDGNLIEYMSPLSFKIQKSAVKLLI